jgi:flagellar motor switch protein FliN/FliY
MAKAAEAVVDKANPPSPTSKSQKGDKKQVQSVELPEAQDSGATTTNAHLDILLDMDVPVTVVLGTTQVCVRRLLQLGPGAVLKLEKPVEAPVDLFLKDSKFAEADVVVVDNRFAVRIRQITRAGIATKPSEG